jgi:hypothetical protein
MGARTRIARLRQSVQAWTDGDRLLPADGSALLAALDRALHGLSDEREPAARAAMERFIRRVQGLLEGPALQAGDGQPWLDQAAAVLGLLRDDG